MFGSFKRFLKKISCNPFLPIVFCTITFLSWSVPYFDIVYSVLVLFLSLIPLFTGEYKVYLYLLLFTICMNNGSDFKIFDITLTLIICYGIIFTSIIIYLFLNKVKFYLGSLFIPILGLFVVVLSSCIVYYVTNGFSNEMYFEYGVLMLFLVLVYIFFSTIFAENQSFYVLCELVSYFAVLLVCQIGLYYILNSKELFDESVKTIDVLGYSSKNIVSFVLFVCLSLIGVNIYRKLWWHSIYFVVGVVGVVLLLSDISVFGFIFFLIPIIFISFRSYKKAGPYIYVFSLAFIIFGLIFVLIFSDVILSNVVNSLKILNFSNNKFSESYSLACQYIKEHPIIGVSWLGLGDIYSGIIPPFNNDILTCMVYSGTLGLLFYIAHTINFYFVCFKRKTTSKWHMFLIILMLTLFGLFTESIFDPNLLFIVLLVSSCYQNSKSVKNVFVSREYYESRN